MKKVLILFGRSNWYNSVPFKNKNIKHSYECFYNLCYKENIQLYRASLEWYDYENCIFKQAWTFNANLDQWERAYDIKPDLIYDKTKASMESYYKKELISEKYLFINNLSFTKILDDKLVTSLIFSKWSKKSWLVNNEEKLRRILPKIKSYNLVIKPISESGGKNVQFLNKDNVTEKAVLDRDCLVQEFIDSSSGVPGIKTSNSMHDLRLVFVNEKLIYSYIREPEEGSFLANLAQGGTLHIVPEEKIPISLKPIINYAHSVFETFADKVYCIDFMFDENERPWIVELNSMPGLYFTSQEKPYMEELYKELILLFKRKIA
jgi:glutathione synthase/RimK-type ligase-like ATP-grasp enzyme